MIHMEVDLHSPSFTALRSFSTKRARSQESPHDRPSKRLSLALDHSKPRRFKYTHSSGNATPQSPASSSRFPSEDWVHQADGLTIDSPVIPGSGLAEDHDEDMNMDPDEPIAADHTQQQTQGPDLPTIQNISFPQATLYQHQQQHPQNTPLSTTVPTAPSPLVTVLPHATAVPPLSISYAPPTRPSTPVAESGGSTAMLLSSPGPSFSSASLVSSRKQRFTMGPRTDCVKCQMGMKGHSVHY